jgi:hypothetical protein
MQTLRALDGPTRVLVTAVLAVLTAGFVVSELYVADTLRRAGGGLGLRAVTLTYHGDPTSSVLEHKATGSMRRYFSAFEDAQQLTDDERADLERVVAWAKAGAPEAEYWDLAARRKAPGPILTIFTRRGCLECHSPLATVVGNKRDSPLDTYADARRQAQPERGMETRRLLLLSHVHLLGLGVVFLLTGAAAVATSCAPRVRASAAVVGPLGALLTIGGWWLTRAYGLLGAPLVLLGALLMALGFCASLTLALVEMWVNMKRTNRGH